jgi:hypothetical protein
MAALLQNLVEMPDQASREEGGQDEQTDCGDAMA